MANDLQDRLSDLAGRTPPGAPPPDLWTRGVRRRRLGQAFTTVTAVIVLVLLVGGAGMVWRGDRAPAPVAPHGQARFPDHFYAPSPWLPTFEGPPGQLVAVIPAERKTILHNNPGLVGVSATTGQYGFLDLPSNAVADANGVTAPPALSPDGRHVAFWTTGTPSGTPNTHLLGMTITGVGVYDVSTGKVRESPLATVHGLDPGLLVWSDARTLVLGLEQASQGDENENSCCQGHWQGLATWHLDDPGGPADLTAPLPLFVEQSSTSAGSGRLVYSPNLSRIDVIAPEPPGAVRRYQLSRPTQYAVMSPDGRRVAAVTGRSGRLMVGRLTKVDQTRTPAVALRQVTAETGFLRPVAWQDARHVVATRRVEGTFDVRVGLYSVDLRTGDTRVLLSPTTDGGALGAPGVLAQELLGARSVHASPPPNPWDQRAVAIGLLVALSIVVVLLLLTWGVRRAARP